jgi:hypothetical protein
MVVEAAVAAAVVAAEVAVATAVAAVVAAAVVIVVAEAVVVAAIAAIAGKLTLHQFIFGGAIINSHRQFFLQLFIVLFLRALWFSVRRDHPPRFVIRNKSPRNVFETSVEENHLPADLCSIFTAASLASTTCRTERGLVTGA